MVKKSIINFVLVVILTLPGLSMAEEYLIDTKGAHAFIQFRIKHLGYSWLYGRFNNFSGSFSYDEKNPNASKVDVIIKTDSIDSNHAERDKHLRGEKFLNIKKYPEARFTSTRFKDNGDGTAILNGNFTLNGVTRNITIDVRQTGHGPDPWGGYRRGFEGTTTLKLADFNITYDLGPASREFELIFSIEGIRQ
jgi:polyisoprenoid-binding protein YceI